MAFPGIPTPRGGTGGGSALRKRRRRPTLEPMGSEGNVPRPIRLSARIAADLHNNALVPFPWVTSQAQVNTRLLSNAAEGRASLLHPDRAGVASGRHRGASSVEPGKTREDVLDGPPWRRGRRAFPGGSTQGAAWPPFRLRKGLVHGNRKGGAGSRGTRRMRTHRQARSGPATGGRGSTVRKASILLRSY